MTNLNYMFTEGRWSRDKAAEFHFKETMGDPDSMKEQFAATSPVKLADKISNIRDMISSPPSDWSIERREEYFEWAARVVAGLCGVNARLALTFDSLMLSKPGVAKTSAQAAS